MKIRCTRIGSPTSGCGPNGQRHGRTSRARTLEWIWSPRSARVAAAPFSASSTRRVPAFRRTLFDSFISASARDPFTGRMVIDTGHAWGPNAVKTIEGLTPACQVVRFNDLADRPIDWPNLRRQDPEALRWRPEPFSPRPHQRAAVEDVVRRFHDHDRRQTHHGVRHRQDVHGHVHRRDHGRRRRAGPLPGAFDLAVPAIDAGVGRAADRVAPLHRDLLGHPRRGATTRTPRSASWRFR